MRRKIKKSEVLKKHLPGIRDLLLWYEKGDDVGEKLCPLCSMAARIKFSQDEDWKFDSCMFCPWIILEKTHCYIFVIGRKENKLGKSVAGLQVPNEENSWWRSLAIRRLKRWIKTIENLEKGEEA